MANALTYKQRYEIAHGIKRGKVTPKNADLIIVDRSGSMGLLAIGGKGRIECVREALGPFKNRAHVLAFNDQCVEVDCDTIPDASGGTDLARALSTANSLEPIHVLVMCDGEPNNGPKALKVAGEIAKQCIIDALYIGPEDDTTAIGFMKELAAVGHGRFSMFNLNEQSPLLLSQGVATMLALPDPDSVVKL